VIITLITAFALTDTGAGESLIEKGLLTGIQMNFRAVVIILGFSVLGTELYNPAVRSFFLKTSFRNLPLAIELSVESLPGFIAGIPDFKSLVRNPVSIFYQVISHAEKRFSEIKNKEADYQRVFILTGSIGEGKTTYAKKLIDLFRNKGTSVGGIISERVMVNSHTTGYDLVNIETGESAILLRQDEKCGSERIGRYIICKGGIERGNEILSSLACRKIQLIIIDEVGLLELQDKGWTESINRLLAESSVNLLITVRTDYVDAVIKKWDIRNAVTFDVRKTEYTDIGASILNNMSIRNRA
jgi:nucleoside-triphosphatase THEP1